MQDAKNASFMGDPGKMGAPRTLNMSPEERKGLIMGSLMAAGVAALKGGDPQQAISQGLTGGFNTLHGVKKDEAMYQQGLDKETESRRRWDVEQTQKAAKPDFEAPKFQLSLDKAYSAEKRKAYARATSEMFGNKYQTMMRQIEAMSATDPENADIMLERFLGMNLSPDETKQLTGRVDQIMLDKPKSHSIRRYHEQYMKEKGDLSSLSMDELMEMWNKVNE